MGNILRRQRNTVEELDQIVQKLQSWEKQSGMLRRGKYNTMWWFTILLLFVTSVYSAIFCLDASDAKQNYQRIALVWILGLLILFGFRFAARVSFDFLLRRTERNIVLLNTRRTQIIENVKENEKFKVAKEIIEKYGSLEDLAEIGGRKEESPANVKFVKPRVEKSVPAPSEEPKITLAEAAGTELVPCTPSSTVSARNLRTPLQRRPIRPFVQVSRTPIDRVLDYILGDGPTNRFALICRQCHAHNGMALREEFEGISFVCYNCGFYNPARNAKPLRTPRRAVADVPSTEPHSRPYIRTATNTDSSDNEEHEDDDRADRKD